MASQESAKGAAVQTEGSYPARNDEVTSDVSGGTWRLGGEAGSDLLDHAKHEKQQIPRRHARQWRGDERC